MTDCTISVWFKLLTVANNYGWLVSSDNGGYDRGVIVHDTRFGGGVAPIPGVEYSSGLPAVVEYSSGLPAPTLNEWSHVVVVYRQGGESAAFLNGVKSNPNPNTNNGEGFTQLTVGGHKIARDGVDAWVKSITIWSEALSDVDVRQLSHEWSPPASHAYTLMSGALSWGGASAACLREGLQLATVQSAAQNELLFTVAAGNQVWIGGTDAASEGAWVWNPSNTPLSYTNWHPGEPNSHGSGEDCMDFWGHVDGKWNDNRCTRKYKYVCQQPN
eukprot:scaffold77025_cov69-Phaeocystis_antarctica.AAC.1